jgi:hypothetical protein
MIVTLEGEVEIGVAVHRKAYLAMCAVDFW